ncbi:MAG TPA: YceI family protein [Gaiellaceae bacterium]|nr:YceI family protein [Gaiellaceae bacterium]
MSTTTDTRQALPVGTWQLDPVHSTIGFEVDYMGGAFRGQFREVTAELDAEGETPILTGSAKVASADLKDENLTAHIQSPDFFDAERFPALSFESSEIDRAGDQITVRGGITIKGVEKPVELTGTLGEPITDPYGRERISLKLDTKIDRQEFGVNWNVPLPDGTPALADEVKLAAELYLVREA